VDKKGRIVKLYDIKCFRVRMRASGVILASFDTANCGNLASYTDESMGMFQSGDAKWTEYNSAEGRVEIMNDGALICCVACVSTVDKAISKYAVLKVCESFLLL